MNLFHSAVKLLLAIVLASPLLAWAMPLEPNGQWYELAAPTSEIPLTPSQLELAELKPTAQPSLTGGRFFFRGDFSIEQAGNYVLDFKNSSTIALFHHTILNAKGEQVASSAGGIMSQQQNPFFLRHGRPLSLTSGHYRLITELTSPYFIAPPQPYINSQDMYTQSIKKSNALTLLCLGIFIALGIYYAALAGLRWHMAEAMYAIFIFCNLAFNAASLLVLSDLLDWHVFSLTSLPILFSNMAYIAFVMHLLNIKRRTHRKLFYAGCACLSIMLIMLVLAFLNFHWALELARYGVGIFLCYGLTAGLTTSYRGNPAARLYVIAILAFFALGGLTISSKGLMGEYTFYIEHLGLLSVATEAILLALVLSYQFAQLHRDKQYALLKQRQSEHIAMTDTLTGLPNRYALEKQLDKLPAQGCLTFLDLDNLKYYNDTFGHERGDLLLQEFGRVLQNNLAPHATLHRLGGDEFAITCAIGQQDFIEAMLMNTVLDLKENGFEFAGFSSGTVHVKESTNTAELMHMADTRMYEDKRQRKNHEKKNYQVATA